MATGTTPTLKMDRALDASATSASRPEQERPLALPVPARSDAIGGGEAIAGEEAISRGEAASGGARHFVRHLIEMLLAMMIGMMALGAVDAGVLSALGTSVSHVRTSAPELVALVMALNMTIGMTVWMRHRGHSWIMCAEMAGAMFIPAIAALVLLWCGVIHRGSVQGVEHAPMLPAMIVVMLLRRAQYSQPVHSRARTASGQPS